MRRARHKEGIFLDFISFSALHLAWLRDFLIPILFSHYFHFTFLLLLLFPFFSHSFSVIFVYVIYIGRCRKAGRSKKKKKLEGLKVVLDLHPLEKCKKEKKNGAGIANHNKEEDSLCIKLSCFWVKFMTVSFLRVYVGNICALHTVVWKRNMIKYLKTETSEGGTRGIFNFIENWKHFVHGKLHWST